MGIYIDEDFFDKKRQDYSEEEWKKIVGKWILLDHYVEAKLFKQGRISKIIFHRFSHGGYRIFNVNRTDLMGSNEFNSLFDIKPIDIKLFKNAVRQVIQKLNSEEAVSIPPNPKGQVPTNASHSEGIGYP